MTTTTLTLNDGWLSRRNLFDWVFAALVLAGGVFALKPGIKGLAEPEFNDLL